MTVDTVTATRVRCDRDDYDARCAAYLMADGVLAPDPARRAAAERGWQHGPDGDRCPRHREPS